MLKTILVIDDKDRESIFKTLRSKAQQCGIVLDLYQFNPGGAKENDLLNISTRELDVKKTIEKYKEYFNNKIFDVIACDWNLNVPNINGLELIRQISCINTTIRDTPKMLYSGTLEEELHKMLLAIINEPEEQKRRERIDKLAMDIKLLVNSEFFSLSGREDIEDELIPYFLKKNPADVRILHVLHDNPQLKFSVNCGKFYAGMTFKEAERSIEQSERLKAELVQDIVEAAISFLEHKIGEV